MVSVKGRAALFDSSFTAKEREDEAPPKVAVAASSQQPSSLTTRSSWHPPRQQQQQQQQNPQERVPAAARPWNSTHRSMTYNDTMCRPKANKQQQPDQNTSDISNDPQEDNDNHVPNNDDDDDKSLGLDDAFEPTFHDGDEDDEEDALHIMGTAAVATTATNTTTEEQEDSAAAEYALEGLCNTPYEVQLKMAMQRERQRQKELAKNKYGRTGGTSLAQRMAAFHQSVPAAISQTQLHDDQSSSVKQNAYQPSAAWPPRSSVTNFNQSTTALTTTPKLTPAAAKFNQSATSNAIVAPKTAGSLVKSKWSISHSAVTSAAANNKKPSIQKLPFAPLETTYTSATTSAAAAMKECKPTPASAASEKKQRTIQKLPFPTLETTSTASVKESKPPSPPPVAAPAATSSILRHNRFSNSYSHNTFKPPLSPTRPAQQKPAPLSPLRPGVIANPYDDDGRSPRAPNLAIPVTSTTNNTYRKANSTNTIVAPHTTGSLRKSKWSISHSNVTPTAAATKNSHLKLPFAPLESSTTTPSSPVRSSTKTKSHQHNDDDDETEIVKKPLSPLRPGVLPGPFSVDSDDEDNDNDALCHSPIPAQLEASCLAGECNTPYEIQRKIARERERERQRLKMANVTGGAGAGTTGLTSLAQRMQALNSSFRNNDDHHPQPPPPVVPHSVPTTPITHQHHKKLFLASAHSTAGTTTSKIIKRAPKEVRELVLAKFGSSSSSNATNAAATASAKERYDDDSGTTSFDIQLKIAREREKERRQQTEDNDLSPADSCRTGGKPLVHRVQELQKSLPIIFHHPHHKDDDKNDECQVNAAKAALQNNHQQQQHEVEHWLTATPSAVVMANKAATASPSSSVPKVKTIQLMKDGSLMTTKKKPKVLKVRTTRKLMTSLPGQAAAASAVDTDVVVGESGEDDNEENKEGELPAMMTQEEAFQEQLRIARLRESRRRRSLPSLDTVARSKS